MAENESIGGISVDIVGDYSKLQGDIEAATQVAEQGGQEIAQAFTAASQSADTLEAAIQSLVNSGSTLAEALAQVQAQETATGQAAADAATQLSLFDEAVQVPYADAAGQLNLFATELEPIAGSSQDAAAGLAELARAQQEAATNAALAATAESEFAAAESEVEHSSHEAASALGELGEKLVAFGEGLALAEGLKEFGQEALTASDNITRASISLTALTGSADKAEETIQGIEKLGISDGLALPSLLQASTRMTAILGPGADVVGILGQVANAAAVMGTNIEAAANSFDRIVAGGTLGARQLVQVGLSLDQVAEAMNKVSGDTDATAENVAKMFKAMDQSDRVEVLTTALQRLDGVAQKAAEDTFGGQWQTLANQWEQIMRDVGDALLPVIKGLTDLMKVDVLPFLKSMAESFRELPGPVQEVVVGIGLLAAAIVPLTLAVGGFGLALDAAGAALAPLVGLMGGFAAVAGVALVSALAAAALGFTDLKNSMAGLHEQEQAMDQAFQKYIAGLASGATTQLQVTEAQEKINSALANGLISATLAAQGLALLDAAEKKILGNNMSEMFDQMGIHLKIVSDAMTPAAAATAGLQAKLESLTAAVSSARDKMVAASAAYKDGTGDADAAAKAYDKWQAATNALKAAHEATLPVMQAHLVALRDMVTLAGSTYPSAVKVAADAQDALNIKLELQVETLRVAQSNLDNVLQRYRDGAANAIQVAKALDLVTAAQNSLDQAIGKAPVIDFTPAVVTGKQANQVLTDLLGPLQLLPRPAATVNELLDDMGVKINIAGDLVKNKLIADYDELATKTHTLEEENAAWDKIAGSLQKLSKTDLPEVLKLYDEHLAQLTQEGAAEGLLLDTQAKRLQTVIDIDAQSGKSATNEIIALNNVKLQQQALTDQTKLMGDTIAGVENDAIKGFENMGGAISRVIVEGGSMADAFKKIGQQIVETILTTIINAGLKAIVDMIVSSVLPSIATTGPAFAAVNTSIVAMQTTMTSAVASMSASIQSLNGQLTQLAATLEGTAATGGGASGGGVGGNGILGIVASLATAVSSIIGNFQTAHMEKLLGEIEVSTRGSLAEALNLRADLWKQHDDYLNKWDTINTDLSGYLADLRDRSVDILGAIKTGFYTVVTVLVSGYVPPTGGQALPSVPAGSIQPASVSGGVYGAAVQQGGSIGTIQFNVNGAQDPRATARGIVQLLKTVSPQFATAAT